MEILRKGTVSTYAEAVPFPKISTPGNDVKFWYFKQCDASASTSDEMKEVRIMLNETTLRNDFLANNSASSLVKNIQCNRT